MTDNNSNGITWIKMKCLEMISAMETLSLTTTLKSFPTIQLDTRPQKNRDVKDPNNTRYQIK